MVIPNRTGIAWTARRMMYLIIAAPLVLVVRIGSGRPSGYAEDRTRGARVAGARSDYGSRMLTPWSVGVRYPFRNQSPAFQVMPAWVGFAKKFPSLGEWSST